MTPKRARPVVAKRATTDRPKPTPREIATRLVRRYFDTMTARGPGCEEWPVTVGDGGLWAGPIPPPAEPVDAEPKKETT